MANYQHDKLFDDITKLTKHDSSLGDASTWQVGKPLLHFLVTNDLSSRLVILASSDNLFVQTAIVNNSKLEILSKEQMLDWNFSIPQSSAGYCFTFNDMSSLRLESSMATNPKTGDFENAIPLIYFRFFDGLIGETKSYYEVNQILVHAADLHWVPERDSFCNVNRLGNITDVISITRQSNRVDHISLISVKPDFLEDFLVATNSSLVRLFEFDLDISKPPGKDQDEVIINQQLFYRIYYDEINKTFMKGVQILKPVNSRLNIFNRIVWGDSVDKKYVEFIALDLKDNQVKLISTDPEKTSNFFNQNFGDKPLEISPAFFNVEVLNRYKSDKDKYSFIGRSLHCRGAWYLKSIDINEAGQVHAYICDLRKLPYEEQIYWKSFNEEPIGKLSERAVQNDLLGNWYIHEKPIDKILSMLKKWESEKVKWWKRRTEDVYSGFTFPLQENSLEWTQHFMELAKLVIEGFQLTQIKQVLDKKKIEFSDSESNKSLLLLEKVLAINSDSKETQELKGLRTVQQLRTKLVAHVGGSDSLRIRKNALTEFGSYEEHFQNICESVYQELEMIEAKFNELDI